MSDKIDILITPRQLELLALVANGHDMVSIAEMKFLSPHTVRNTLYNARDRVGARNLTHLAVICVDRGLIYRNGTGFIPRVDERLVD